MAIGICKVCKKQFKYDPYSKRGKYCTKLCFSKVWKAKEIKCKHCGKVFSFYGKKRTFCSLPCHYAEFNGKLGWTKNTIKKLKAVRGSKRYNWKGDNVSYIGIHNWVRREKTKPKNCQFCGKQKKLEWANKDRKYKRNLDDFIALCISCHRKYDKRPGPEGN